MLLVAPATGGGRWILMASLLLTLGLGVGLVVGGILVHRLLAG